jgi:hypothetical protein
MLINVANLGATTNPNVEYATGEGVDAAIELMGGACSGAKQTRNNSSGPRTGSGKHRRPKNARHTLLVTPGALMPITASLMELDTDDDDVDPAAPFLAVAQKCVATYGGVSPGHAAKGRRMVERPEDFVRGMRRVMGKGSRERALFQEFLRAVWGAAGQRPRESLVLHFPALRAFVRLVGHCLGTLSRDGCTMLSLERVGREAHLEAVEMARTID